MRILFAIINYNTSALTARLVESIAVSLSETTQPNIPHVNIIVYCNHCVKTEELNELCEKLNSTGLSYDIVADNNNTGYLGRLADLQRRTSEVAFDFVVYSNADLVIDKSFIKELADFEPALPDSCGLIAPSIISRSTNDDSNPKYLERLPLSKLRRLQWVYSSQILFSLYSAAGYVKSRINGALRSARATSLSKGKAKDIYATHGAMFIFSSSALFQQIPRHVCFMFGEEIHIAECAMRLGYSTRYMPTLVVFDDQHASIASVPSARVRIWYKESIDGLISTHYCN